MCQIVVGRGELGIVSLRLNSGRKWGEEINFRKRKILLSLSLIVMDSAGFITLMLVTLVLRPTSLLLEKAPSG